MLFQERIDNLSLEEESKYSEDDRCEIFVFETYRRLDAEIIYTIAKAMDRDAVKSDLAGPAGMVGGAVGGGLSLAAGGVPLVGATSATASKLAQIGEVKKEHDIAKRVYQFFPRYEDKRTNEWRELFVSVLTETFINYNVVFCDLLQSPTDGVERALNKMAKDIVHRMFNYLENEKTITDFDEKLMVKAILYGESEKGVAEKAKNIFVKRKSDGGGEIKTNEDVYKTGSLHSKCDVIHLQENAVNKKPDSLTYRYSFEGEQIPDGASLLSEYPLSTRDKYEELTEKKSQIIKRILEKLNGDPMKKELTPTSSEKIGPTTPYGQLLEKLRSKNKTEESVSALEKYFPFQLSVRDLTVEVDDTTQTVSAAPMRMLSTILKMNLEGRDCLEQIEKNTRHNEEPTEKNEEPARRRRRRGEKKENSPLLSPQDLFMVAYQSCDAYLQQLLAEKMFQGKLAVPFLLPSPSKANTNILTCWPLRSTLIEWKDREECSTTHKAKTVSVIRVGRPELSKSDILNDVISRDNQKIFFNRNCPQGGERYDRILSSGSVEMSWFLPKGDKTDEVAEEATRILNLRGDALDFENKIDYLAQISTVMVVMIEPSKVKEGLETIEKLKSKSLKKFGCQVVYLWSQERGLKEEADVLDDALDIMETEEKDDLIEADVEEHHALISSLKDKVRTRLSEGYQELSHEDIISKLKCVESDSETIEVDEDQTDCRKGLDSGEAMIKYFKDKSVRDCKKEFLPLQTEQLWGEWSHLEKEKKRADYENRDGMSKRMNKIREEQARKGATDFVKEFIHQLHILKNNPQATSVFLQTLRLHLDSLTHKCMPGLRRRRKLLFNELRKEQEMKENVGHLENSYEDLVKEISNSSFGLEHVFREISQIYEAMHHDGQLENNEYFGEKLPELVANLIAHGISFEIMDGEASNIPRLWMKAVFKNLNKHRLLEGQMGHPISVCGVQSSGKSTLLNSMFGLNFSVSAGRCTRGVFMKIVPANKKEKEMGKIKYDFLLVIDTEGLNAPELLDDKKKEQRDNELATLAVGLGHITLINLKGENISEMKDILQIVILAFLRMKLGRSNENPNSKSNLNGCMFLHQNVSAVNAGEKMQEGLQKLQKTLDIATREVAETENQLSIRTFTQVLNFDPEEHVLYFPSLWKGDPPMAPVNPGYSEKAGIAKEVTQMDLKRKEKPCLNFNQIFENIDTLWKGILAENFVFNFKNNEYIKAYDSLEKKYKELIFEIQEYVLEWRRKRGPEVEQQGDKISLEEKWSELEHSLTEEAEQKHLQKKEEFEQFFAQSNNQYSDILEKWKTPKLHEFDEKIKSIIRLECKRLRNSVDMKIRNCSVEESKKEYKEDLAARAKHRARVIYDQMREEGHEFEDEGEDAAVREERKRQKMEKLRSEFDSFWSQWMSELKVVPSTNTYKFRTEKARDCLRERLTGQEQKALNDKLNEREIDNRCTRSKYKTCEDVQTLVLNLREEDFDVKQSFFHRVETFLGGKSHLVPRAAQIVSFCLASVLSHLEEFEKTPKEFDPHMLHKLFKLCDLDNYRAETNEETSIKFTKEFRIMVIVKVFTHALKVFDEMQAIYEERTSIKNRVEAEKEDFWNMFRSVFVKEDEEITLANMFVRILKPKIIAKVDEYLEHEIYTLTIHTNSDKTQILVKVLRDLVEGDWKKFQAYLRSAKQECKDWLTKRIKEEFFSAKGKSNRYQEKARAHLLKISLGIRESIDEAKNEECEGGETEVSLVDWLNSFRLNEKLEVGFAVNDFFTMTLTSSTTIKDMDNFIKNVRKELDNCEDEIRKLFDGTTIRTDIGHGQDSPFHKAFDEVWGCNEQCPFCGEFCRLGEKHEGTDHICLQHRPDGLNGTYWEPTNNLSTYSCSFSVQSSHRFGCGFCRRQELCTTEDCKEYHDFKEYKKYFKEWDIYPSADKTEKSEFWAFMMHKHAKELSEHFGKGFPDMPPSWETITPEQAKESLNNLST